MKKIFILVTAAVLMILSFSACNKSGDGNFDDEDIPKELSYDISSKTYEDMLASEDTVIASYNYTFPNLIPSDERGDEIAETFNSYIDSLAEEKIEAFKDTVYEKALSEFEELGKEAWGEKVYTQEIKFDFVKSIDYLAVTFDSITTEEAVTPGFFCKMYDLKNGKLFELEELSDEPDELKNAVSSELLVQLEEQGVIDYLNEDYEEKVRSLEGAEVYFCEDGLIVIFPPEVIGPKEIGMQCLLVDYSVIDVYLNDYALSLLYEYTGVVG